MPITGGLRYQIGEAESSKFSDFSGTSRFGKVPSVQPFQLSPNASTEVRNILEQSSVSREQLRKSLTLHLL